MSLDTTAAVALLLSEHPMVQMYYYYCLTTTLMCVSQQRDGAILLLQDEKRRSRDHEKKRSTEQIARYSAKVQKPGNKKMLAFSKACLSYISAAAEYCTVPVRDVMYSKTKLKVRGQSRADVHFHGI
jgi:hypothetical protein